MARTEAQRKYQREYMREWKKRNPERVKELHRRYYHNNKEKSLSANKRWRKANPERTRAVNRNYYRRHPERGREQQLKCLYDLTLLDYQNMVSSQNNQCAICDRTFEERGVRKACVDHNHTTGQVRLILCRRCNLTVGYIEGPDFTKAMEYVKRFANETEMS